MKLLLTALTFVSLASAEMFEQDGPMLRGRMLEIVLGDEERAIEPDEVMTLYVDGEEGIYEVDGNRRKLASDSGDDDSHDHPMRKINIVINNKNKCKNNNDNSNSIKNKHKNHHSSNK